MVARRFKDVEEELADAPIPAAAPGLSRTVADIQASGDNWIRVRKTWADARDWIEAIIEEIVDGRERAKYNRLSRRDYEPVITLLRKDNRISAEAAADLIALNEDFLRLKRNRAATKTEADEFDERFWRATEPKPSPAPVVRPANWASEGEIRRFWEEPTWNDLTGTAADEPAQRARLAERFEVFIKRPDAQELIDCFALYLARCVPFPFRTAHSRWVISVPAGRRSNIANLSIGMQWAAVCYVNDEGKPLFDFYASGSILKREFGRKLERLAPDACDAFEAAEVAGGADQWRLACYPREVRQLLDRHEVVRAMRRVSIELIKREPLHRQHHCFDLADAVLAKVRAMSAKTADRQ
jgi:hypothetical protein